VRECLSPFLTDPLIRELWPAAVRAGERHGKLGQALSQARHRLEAAWGLATYELPFSELCQREPFRWFVAHLLAQLPRFQEIYNSSLAEYRRVHRLRSRTHPVPKLAQQDEWREAPLWVWRADDPVRRRLFVRRQGRELELSDLRRSYEILSLPTDGDGAVAVDQLADLESRGIRVRPRALLTTMFARLLLCDLFFHGIGGAKYDQLTDRIIQRFFGFVPPTFLVVSATAQLPIVRPKAKMEDLRRVDWLLRELRYNPQRHVAMTRDTEPLVVAKQRCIESDASGSARIVRHREFLSVNQSLQPFVEPQRQKLLRQRADCVTRLRQERVLGSREYAFCLFPERTLRPFLLDI
jgi:hypothetical protein